MAGPDIVTRGFVYVRESENLIENAKVVVTRGIGLDCLESRRNADWGKIKMVVKDSLGEYIMEDYEEKSNDFTNNYGSGIVRSLYE